MCRIKAAEQQFYSAFQLLPSFQSALCTNSSRDQGVRLCAVSESVCARQGAGNPESLHSFHHIRLLDARRSHLLSTSVFRGAAPARIDRAVRVHLPSLQVTLLPPCTCIYAISSMNFGMRRWSSYCWSHSWGWCRKKCQRTALGGTLLQDPSPLRALNNDSMAVLGAGL